jgi:plasmid stabilization system protein ParE
VPEAGRDELRQVLHGKYRLIYRIEPTRLVVLTVRHCRRQWDPAELMPEA